MNVCECRGGQIRKRKENVEPKMDTKILNRIALFSGIRGATSTGSGKEWERQDKTRQDWGSSRGVWYGG